MTKPIKVMVYDSSTLEDGWDGLEKDGLALSWKWGDKLYRLFRSIDVTIAAPTLDDALDELALLAQKHQISEIQFWGHGSPGAFWIGNKGLSRGTLKNDEKHKAVFAQVKAALTKDALIWFRACSVFAGAKGRKFGMAFAEMINDEESDRKVAAHTYIIGPWQSGLHTLGKGQTPYWPEIEGIEKGDAYNIEKLKWSGPFCENTINCLRSSIPKGW